MRFLVLHVVNVGVLAMSTEMQVGALTIPFMIKLDALVLKKKHKST